MRIPADIDREGPLVFGLSARQVCILAVTTVIAWVVYEIAHELVPDFLAAALVTPIAAVGLTIALGRRDGITGDRFALAVLRYKRSPRRLVPMSDDGVPPCALRSFDRQRLAPLELPVRGMNDEGRLDLGLEGAAMLARVAPINFTLRTAEEQSQLVAGFARFLNSLHAPIQIVVRSQHADLSPLVDEVYRAAPTLPHPELEAAAFKHGSFLEELASTHDILRREVLLVIRATTSAVPADLSARRDEVCAALAESGVVASRLDGSDAAAALERAMTTDAAIQDLSAPGEVVRGRRAPAA